MKSRTCLVPILLAAAATAATAGDPAPPAAAPSTTDPAKPAAKNNPAVGRKVWYNPPSGTGLTARKGQPYSATITHVWGDNCVNLDVKNDGSFPLPAGLLNPTSVMHGAGEGQWRWPDKV